MRIVTSSFPCCNFCSFFVSFGASMLVEYIGFVDFEENVLAYLAFTFVMSPFGAVYLYIKYLEARSEAVPHQGVTRFAYSLGLGDLLARLVLDVASTVPMRHLSLSLGLLSETQVRII